MNEAPGSQAQSIPDVFIDAAPEDWPQLRPLIARLISGGWSVLTFDDGFFARGERWDAALTLLRSSRVVLVPVGTMNRVLGRDEGARQTIGTSRATVFGLRFSDSDAAPDVKLAGILDLRTEAGLIDAVLQITDAITSGSTSRRETSSQAQSFTSDLTQNSTLRPAESNRLRLQLGNEKGTEDWTVAEPLRRVLLHGARYWPRSSKRERFTLSFKTLLLSLFNTADRWSIWARETGSRAGFQASRVFEEQDLTREEIAERSQRPLTDAEGSATVAATTSCAAILRSAREHARRAGGSLDIQHVLAALVHDPAGHEEQLASWGFVPEAWSAALAEETAARAPQESQYFAELHRERFPTAMWEGAAPKSTDGAASDDFRLEEADESLKRSLAMAAALASQGGTITPVNSRHLLAGLVGSGALASLSLAWGNALKLGSDNPSLRSSESALASLGFSASVKPVQSIRELPPLGDEVRRVLRSSRRPRERTNTSALDVFVELWTPNDGAAAPMDAILQDIDVDPEGALDTLSSSPSLASHAASLRTLLDSRRAAVAWTRPELRNDRVDGAVPFENDMLAVGPAAKRFAKLLADKSVKPPLAVGLFGNWGSGKTFFMGLMRSHVNELMQMKSSRYARRVVQIEFNAWHYHDTNLWASLAIHIFDRLAHALSPQENAVDATRRQLHERMSSTKAHRREAKEQRDQALARRTEAARTLEQKRGAREERVRRSERRRIEIAWNVVSKGQSFQALRDAANAFTEQFGITQAADSVEGLRALRGDIEKTRAHGFGLFTAIGRRFQDTSRGVWTVTLLVGALMVALALGWGTEWVFEQLKMLAPRYTGTVVEVATMFSVVVAWCGRRVRQLQTGLENISALEADVAAAEKKVDAGKDEALKELEQELAALDKEILEADGKVVAADHEIAAAQAEIDRIDRGGLVYDFLQQRRTSAVYTGQLGLISTIRRDLQDLDALLEDFAKHAKDEAPAIDRILLYIDDLDRCHPDKVLEVLQAVHLLLTFDLFNVVVGVDARWLERSLRRQYEQKLGGRALAADGFSPHDYLEKIFQIPYALGGMDPEGFEKFVDNLIETRSEWKERRAREALEERTRQEQKLAKKVDSADPSAVEQQARESDPARQRAADTKSETAQTGKTPAKTDADRRTNDETLPPSVVEPPQYLEDHEATFIAALYPFIDRPRLAKRFVNIYKLLRVTADDEGRGADFARQASAEGYRAALVLLAIHIGHNQLSMRMVPELLRTDASTTWPAFLAGLADSNGPGARLSSAERSEVARMRATLQGVGRSVQIPDGLAAYKHWAQRVLCYSFEPLQSFAAPPEPRPRRAANVPAAGSDGLGTRS